MNYTSLFYWLTVADNAKDFFITFIVIFTIISTISTVAYLICGNEDHEDGQAMSRKWMWWSYPFMILFWALYVFTPSKKDALLIVAGGQTLNFLTTDSSARKIPHELSDFVLTELKNMSQEVKVDLNLTDQKEKILEEAKSMTGKQLIERMKNDTTFANFIKGK